MMLTNETEGVFHGLDARLYHSAPGASSTMLRNLGQSPAHMKTALLEQRDTPALVFGRVVHQLVLEPEARPWWVVPPEGCDLRTKEGKAWKAAHEHQKLIKREAFADMVGAAESVKANPLAAQALASSHKEVSVFRRFTLGRSVLRRGRMDIVCSGPVMADLKTCEDARPGPFSQHMANFGYHIQAAYYLDLWNSAVPEEVKTSFVIFAVEKTPPYAVGIYNLDPQAIECGRAEYIDLLVKYMECEAKNEWPAYPCKITPLNLPAWFYKKADSLYE